VDCVQQYSVILAITSVCAFTWGIFNLISWSDYERREFDSATPVLGYDPQYARISFSLTL
jgi:hypothetical protein